MLAKCPKCPRLPSTVYWASTASELNYVQEIVGQVLHEMGQICAREYTKIFDKHHSLYAEFNTTSSYVLIMSAGSVSELPMISCK